jgi:hypothetical protein
MGPTLLPALLLCAANAQGAAPAQPTAALQPTIPAQSTAAAQQAASAQPFEPERVFWDTLDLQGRLIGGELELMSPRKGSITAVQPALVTTLTPFLVAPNPANRIDLVIVGDGYPSSQLGTYATQAATIATNFFNKEPYLTYKPLFLVHRVDVVSVDSGVDNDPTQGIQRNTAMDMGYWCNGIDRLLCVDVTKAYQFANNAPDVDLVLALANSSTYGGAGYSSNDLATSAAGNGAALEIVRHEFGHALGNLADEYDYGGPATYSGGEPSAPNSSKLNSGAMLAAMAKWHRWLGVNNAGFDGLISTFEGSSYSQFGVYRPTNNSLMRSLDRPFNLPSAESIIIEIYKLVKPIDDATPTTGTLQGTETLFVTPVTPLNNPLAIQWSLNGSPIVGATGTTLALPSLNLGVCGATVSVTVTDMTTMVKDENKRAQFMSESRTWTVQHASAFTNLCPLTPNSAGPGASIQASGSNSLAANNLQLLAVNCPPSVNGIFFFGTAQTQTALGNGLRCAGGSIFRFPITQTNLFGDATQLVNLQALPGGAVIQPGDTRYFQFWFRDIPGGGSGTNLSNTIKAQFCP